MLKDAEIIEAYKKSGGLQDYKESADNGLNPLKRLVKFDRIRVNYPSLTRRASRVTEKFSPQLTAPHPVCGKGIIVSFRLPSSLLYTLS